MRHGDCRQDDVKRYIGQSDLPLNAAGRTQALHWRRALADAPFRRIFCSDLNRSRETARIVADGRIESLQQLHGLREIHLGEWDGLPIDEASRRYPGEYEKRIADIAAYRTPGGESFAELAARVIPLLEDILRKNHGPLLIVGHAGVNRVILCHILGMPMANLFRLHQDYGCLNVINCSREGLTVRRMNICLPTPLGNYSPL